MPVKVNLFIAKGWTANKADFVVFCPGFSINSLKLLSISTQYTRQTLRKVKKVLKKS